MSQEDAIFYGVAFILAVGFYVVLRGTFGAVIRWSVGDPVLWYRKRR